MATIMAGYNLYRWIEKHGHQLILTGTQPPNRLERHSTDGLEQLSTVLYTATQLPNGQDRHLATKRTG